MVPAVPSPLISFIVGPTMIRKPIIQDGQSVRDYGNPSGKSGNAYDAERLPYHRSYHAVGDLSNRYGSYLATTLGFGIVGWSRMLCIAIKGLSARPLFSQSLSRSRSRYISA
jgi:hypothetical protein